MADFAPDYTARIRIRYLAVGRVHTQQWRIPSRGTADITLLSAIGDIQAIYDAIGPGMNPDWTVLSTAVADVNQDIFLPFTGPTASGTGAVTGVGSTKREATQSISFTGRSSGGLRAVVYFYGFNDVLLTQTGDTQSDDFRVYREESAVVADTLDAFALAGSLVGNDNFGLSWNQYINLKANDYWVRKSRQGA